MTPKEKAEELYEKMLFEIEWNAQPAIVKGVTKQCVLITIVEIIKSEPRYPSIVDWDDADGTFKDYYESQREEAKKYWEEVKQELNIL